MAYGHGNQNYEDDDDDQEEDLLVFGSDREEFTLMSERRYTLQNNADPMLDSLKVGRSRHNTVLNKKT